MPIRLKLLAALAIASTQVAAQPGPAPGAAFVLPPVTSTPGAGVELPGGAETTVLRRILVRGNSAVRTEDLDAVAAAYLQRPLSAEDLEDLRQKLTRAYVDRGYVNSGAVYGPDALAGDTLRVDIVEGRLSAIRMHGLERLREGYVRERLGLDPNAILNADELRERFVLLLEDPLFERANARLSPGDKLGEAALDIDAVRARPYQLTVNANNHRPPSVGSQAVGFNGVVRNLTGLGDAVEASYQAPVGEGGRGGRGSLGWTVPLPRLPLELNFQHDEGESSVVEAALRSLDIRSQIRSDEAGVRWLLHEDLQRKFSLGASRLVRENTTTLLGAPFSFSPFEPNGVSKVTAWRTWQQASFRSAAQLLALRSTFTQSQNNLVAIPGRPGGLQVPARNAMYWQGQAQFVRGIGEGGAQLVVRGTMQATAHPLVALDRFAVGGATSVRGYRENTLVRDTGHFVNIEFEQPVAVPSLAGAQLVLVPFYDRGRGRNLGASADWISSAGLATRLRWGAFNLELALARKLGHSPLAPLADRTLQDRGIHFQLGYTVF